jgi:hypothetical protein
MPSGHTPCSPAPSPVLTVVLADADGVYPHEVTIRDRISARVHADRFDHALALGLAPESAAPVMLRARALVAPRSRRCLASALTRILDDARQGSPRWNAVGAAPRRHHVLAARDEIERLAAPLLAPAPVSARGVALVRTLVTDGCGPLYRPNGRADLGAWIRAATSALDPAADWTI